jgi:hypothetical protein
VKLLIRHECVEATHHRLKAPVLIERGWIGPEVAERGEAARQVITGIGWVHAYAITPTSVMNQTAALTPVNRAGYLAPMWFNQNVLHQPDVTAR